MAARTQRPNRRRAKPGAGRSPLASCALCQEKVAWVDYKDIGLLRRYMSDRGKIRARQSTGNCAQHQGEVSVAIKTARELVLLPYAQRTATERRPGRDRVHGTRSSVYGAVRHGSGHAGATSPTTSSEPLAVAGTTEGGRS